MRLKSTTRPAATMVEFAIVAFLTFFLIIGLIVGGAGVFRYVEVASLAREASRQASVHGTQYAKDTGNAAWTATDIYNNVIKPQAAILDLAKLTYSVTWTTSNSPTHTVIANNQLVVVSNKVTVTINYQWIPEAFQSIWA